MLDDQDKLLANFEGMKIAEKYANQPYRFGTLYPTGELTVRTPIGNKPTSPDEPWSPTTPNSFVYDEEEGPTKMYWSPVHGLTPQLHTKNRKFVTWVYVLTPTTPSSEDSPGAPKYSGEWMLLDESNGEDDEELFPEEKEEPSSSPSSSVVSVVDASQETKEPEPEEKKEGVDEEVKLVRSRSPETGPCKQKYKSWKKSVMVTDPESHPVSIQAFQIKKPFK